MLLLFGEGAARVEFDGALVVLYYAGNGYHVAHGKLIRALALHAEALYGIVVQAAHLTEFNESLVRRWVKQITIWDDHITVELKSGVSIDVDA